MTVQRTTTGDEPGAAVAGDSVAHRAASESAAGRAPAQESKERQAPGRELTLKRVFAAPRPLVFAAWTRAEHFARWFGPKDFSIPECTIDPRPGGAIRFSMGEAGSEYWHEGVFREVVEPEQIVFTVRFTDGRGTPVPHPLFPEWPVEMEFVQTVTFAERDGATEVTLHQIIVPPEAAASEVFETERPLARQGWDESFARLDALLEALGV